MRIYRDEIQITRGESFTYDVLIEHIGGAPFIISNRLLHPYFLITVASVKYDAPNRYIHNYWCPIDEYYKRFYCTTPIELTVDAIVNHTPIDEVLSLEAIEDMTKLLETGVIKSISEYAVYYYTDENVKRYYYWDDEAKVYTVYELPFKITFQSSDTLNWVEQEYEFGMKIIDGDTIAESTKPLDKGERPLKNYNYMQTIKVPNKIKVLSNISGSMEV